MALDVGLGHHVDAVAVAEVIPFVSVGVVACAHGVEVEFLHDLDVLKHALAAHVVSAVGIEFVTVGALEEHRLAVDEHLIAFELDLAEAYSHGYGFVSAGQSGFKPVEAWCFGCPFFGRSHFHHGFAAAFDGGMRHFLALRIVEPQVGGAVALELDVDSQASVAIVVDEVGHHADVFHSVFVAGIEIAVASDSAVAHEVLVLEICAVAPSHHLKGDEILFAGHEIGGEVEFLFKLRVLSVADISAVDPKIHVGRNGSEMCYDVFAFPVGGYDECAAV